MLEGSSGGHLLQGFEEMLRGLPRPGTAREEGVPTSLGNLSQCSAALMVKVFALYLDGFSPEAACAYCFLFCQNLHLPYNVLIVGRLCSPLSRLRGCLIFFLIFLWSWMDHV